MRPKAISLFSGCGGSDLGLNDAGFEIIFSNDNSQYACDTYKMNLPDTDTHCCDVSELRSFPKADILIGCYPCQGFSQGGPRKSNRKINYLYREFDRALRYVKPKAFIVENVSGLARCNFKHLFNNQLVRFRLAGYKVEYSILSAADYGVPQTRKRIFFVGIRSGFGIKYKFPKPTHGPNGHLPYVSQRQALSGKSDWPEGEFYNRDFHWYYLSRNRRRAWDEPSATILSNPRHMPLHPMSPPLVKIKHNVWRFKHDGPARRFSYKEAALLQGFPHKFKLPQYRSMEQKYKTIGNAVPPQLFKAVANAIPDIW